ncbi:MAG: amidase family protein, partial [Patescibacteria group bacterium]
VISGPDPLDATSVRLRPPSAKATGGKLGVPYHFLKEGIEAEVLKSFEQSVQELQQLGYQIQEIELPNLRYALPCYYIVMPAEGSSNLGRYDA